MSIKDWIKNAILTFCIVTTGIIILTFFSSMVYSPSSDLKPVFLGQVLLLSLMIALLGLMLYSSRSMSNKEIFVRRVIHLAAIISVVIVSANCFGWNSDNHKGTLLLTVCAVLALYMVVRFIIYQKDKKEADSLNQDIQRHKQKREK